MTSMTNQARITFSSISYPFFLACLRNEARSPSEITRGVTFAELHDYNERMLKVEGLNVLDDERVQIVVAEFLQYLHLPLLILLLIL